MRQEVDAYVEDKFAAFEASLTKTLAAVQQRPRPHPRALRLHASRDGYEG